jgi:molybdate transport system substrate-binding protein
MPRAEITLLSSMATQPLLAALARAHEQAGGAAVRLESVGGVDAARRVQAGEAFDVVVLADDVLVAIAVREGAARPDVGSEDALRRSLLAARSIGYSTGPSGRALLQVFERWGLADTLKDRLVQARPGVPVGRLVAAGEAEIGFQQLSELQGLAGLALLGGMPPGLEIVTTFAGAVGARSAQPEAAQALLDFLASADAAAVKRAHGMDAPAAPLIRKTAS